MQKPKIETCKFVTVTSIVPLTWREWFFEAISANAPFSWGDNNRSLVDPTDFSRHVDDVLALSEDEWGTTHKERQEFFGTLKKLAAKKIYVDLEN